MNAGLTQYGWREFGDLTAKAKKYQLKLMADIINNKLILIEEAKKKNEENN